MLIRFIKIKRRHRERAEIFYAKLDICEAPDRIESVGGFLLDYGTPLNVPGISPIEAWRMPPLACM